MTSEPKKIPELDENYAEMSGLHFLNDALRRVHENLGTLLGGASDGILKQSMQELFLAHEKVKILKILCDREKIEAVGSDRDRRRAFLSDPPDTAVDRVARNIHFRGDDRGQTAWERVPESDRAAAREHARNAISIVMDYN